MKAFLLLPLAAATLLACGRFLSEPAPSPGILTLSFDPSDTRGTADIPDTNSFLLNIFSSDGNTVWAGLYSEAPKELSLSPGSYSVEAVSRTFLEPLFEAPQYGDRQTVSIESGKVAAAHLSCSLLNASVRIQQTEQFRADYPQGTFYVKSADGTLMYSYGEKRTGYFHPGTVWILLNYAGSTKTLATREIQPREVLVLRFGSGNSVMEVGAVAEKYGDGLSIEVDTSRSWTREEFRYGSGSDGSGSHEDLSGALSVGQARSRAEAGASGVWVYGYIVGGDCTSKNCSFSPPFKSNTNIVIAASKDNADRESCMAVQLRQGDIREALNLVDHPELLGKMIYIKGDLVGKYYGIPGIQNLSGYRIQ